jgi:hypothetical protein
MLNAIATVACLAWFALNGLLWYVKPDGAYWLVGSAVLGVLYFVGFFLYLQWSDRA